MMYYIIKDNVQHGPFSKEELRLHDITPETIVWREGMPDWAKASTIPDLEDIFQKEPSHALKSDYVYPAPPASAPDYPGYAPGFNGTPIPHTNWQPWAIVAVIVGALFNCLGLILAIFGLVNANKANKYYAEGWADRGASANSTARTMTIIALVLEALSIGLLAFTWDSVWDSYSRILSMGGAI